MIRNNEYYKKVLDDFFSNVSDDQLKEVTDIVKSLDIKGPSVSDYFNRFNDCYNLFYDLQNSYIRITPNNLLLSKRFSTEKGRVDCKSTYVVSTEHDYSYQNAVPAKEQRFCFDIN